MEERIPTLEELDKLNQEIKEANRILSTKRDTYKNLMKRRLESLKGTMKGKCACYEKANGGKVFMFGITEIKEAASGTCITIFSDRIEFDKNGWQTFYNKESSAKKSSTQISTESLGRFREIPREKIFMEIAECMEQIYYGTYE